MRPATILLCHMVTCAYEGYSSFPLPHSNATLLIQLACYDPSLVGGHLEEDSLGKPEPQDRD